MPRPWIIAHRGASADFPEHSRAAFLEALAQGAHGVEMDLRLTRDQRLLLHHDATFRRCCGDSRRVAELPSTRRGELNACHARPDLAPEPPLLLEEALEILPHGLQLLLELKEGPEQILPLERALGLRREGVVLISFHLPSLVEAGVRLPELRRLWLRQGRREVRPATRRRWLAICHRHGLDGLDVEVPLAWGALPGEVAAAGLELGAWTVDEGPLALRLGGLGLRWITTNRPAALLETG